MGAYPGPRHPPRRGTRGSLCSSGCLCIHASPRPGPLPPGGRNLSPEKLSSQQPGFQYFPACLVPSPGAWHRAQPRREALTRAARTGPPSSVTLSLTAVDSDCCPFRFYPGSHRSPSWCGHGVAVTHRAGPSPRSLGDAPVLGLGQSSPLSPWTSPMRLSPHSGCGTLKATTVSVLSQVQLPVHVVSCSASSQHPLLRLREPVNVCFCACPEQGRNDVARASHWGPDQKRPFRSLTGSGGRPVWKCSDLTSPAPAAPPRPPVSPRGSPDA